MAREIKTPGEQPVPVEPTPENPILNADPLEVITSLEMALEQANLDNADLRKQLAEANQQLEKERAERVGLLNQTKPATAEASGGVASSSKLTKHGWVV